MKQVSSAMRLLVNGAQGIYVPQTFVEDYDMATWEGITPDQIKILAAGPDGDDCYWEVWDEVLSSATCSEAKFTFTLHQDGDLWAICPQLMTNEEHLNFFGEMKPAPDDAYEYEVCETCLQVLANGDAGGSASASEESTSQFGLTRLAHQYGIVDPDGAEFGFSWQDCECCGAIAGNRFRVICSNPKEQVAA
jgi:hypothetical protein